MMGDGDLEPGVETENRAVRLLYPNDKHDKLLIDESGVRLLESLGSEPVSVLSIVGTQREGKSTLLNLLHSRTMNQKNGFGMGHFMQPKTTGLWIRTRKYKAKGFTVIYVDSEGLDSPHVPQFYNWTLSALTLLISDIFIYQSRGNIDNNGINRLHVILQIAEQLLKPIHSSNRKYASNPSENKSMLASLLWLLRDHHLEMIGTPREEMLEKLSLETISSIKRCFKEFDCFPLPQPTSDIEVLRSLENYEFDHLSPQFREEFVVLERKLLDQLRVGRRFGNSANRLTGPDIADLLRKYTNAAFDAGDERNRMMTQLEELPTQAEMVARITAERAVELAVSAYQTRMDIGIKNLISDSKLDLNKNALRVTGDLCDLHQISLIEAESVFKKQIIGEFNAEDNKKYWNVFLNKIEVYTTDIHVRIFPQRLYSRSPIECNSLVFSKVARLTGGNLSKYINEIYVNTYSVLETYLRVLYDERILPLDRFLDLASFDDKLEEVWKEYKEITRHYDSVNIDSFNTLLYSVWQMYEQHRIKMDRNAIISSMIMKPYIETKKKSEFVETQMNELAESTKKQLSLLSKSLLDNMKSLTTKSEEALQNMESKFEQDQLDMKDLLNEKIEAAMKKLETKLDTKLLEMDKKFESFHQNHQEQLEALDGKYSSLISGCESKNESRFNSCDGRINDLTEKYEGNATRLEESLKDLSLKIEEESSLSEANISKVQQFISEKMQTFEKSAGDMKCQLAESVKQAEENKVEAFDHYEDLRRFVEMKHSDNCNSIAQLDVKCNIISDKCSEVRIEQDERSQILSKDIKDLTLKVEEESHLYLFREKFVSFDSEIRQMLSQKVDFSILAESCSDMKSHINEEIENHTENIKLEAFTRCEELKQFAESKAFDMLNSVTQLDTNYRKEAENTNATIAAVSSKLETLLSEGALKELLAFKEETERELETSRDTRCKEITEMKNSIYDLAEKSNKQILECSGNVKQLGKLLDMQKAELSASVEECNRVTKEIEAACCQKIDSLKQDFNETNHAALTGASEFFLHNTVNNFIIIKYLEITTELNMLHNENKETNMQIALSHEKASILEKKLSGMLSEQSNLIKQHGELFKSSEEHSLNIDNIMMSTSFCKEKLESVLDFQEATEGLISKLDQVQSASSMNTEHISSSMATWKNSFDTLKSELVQQKEMIESTLVDSKTDILAQCQNLVTANGHKIIEIIDAKIETSMKIEEDMITEARKEDGLSETQSELSNVRMKLDDLDQVFNAQKLLLSGIQSQQNTIETKLNSSLHEATSRISIVESGLKANVDNLVGLRTQTETLKAEISNSQTEAQSHLLSSKYLDHTNALKDCMNSVTKLRKEVEALWDSISQTACRVTDVQAEIDNVTGRRRR